MARIRTIKPEFFTSESVVSVSPLARLLFIGLWCESDREGRLVWKPKTLKLRYLPADNAKIDKLSDELISEGMIVIYELGGIEYCEIPSFSKHQVINNRERDSEIPPRDSDASTTREPHVKAEGKEGRKGKERKSASFVKPSAIEVQSYFEGKGYSDSKFGESFFNYYESNGWKVGRNPMKSWQSAVSSWITKGSYKKSQAKVEQKRDIPVIDHDALFEDGLKNGL